MTKEDLIKSKLDNVDKQLFHLGIFSLILGVLHFIVFALDYTYDKDFTTWMWLLNSELFFFCSLISLIHYKINKL